MIESSCFSGLMTGVFERRVSDLIEDIEKGLEVVLADGVGGIVLVSESRGSISFELGISESCSAVWAKVNAHFKLGGYDSKVVDLFHSPRITMEFDIIPTKAS